MHRHIMHHIIVKEQLPVLGGDCGHAYCLQGVLSSHSSYLKLILNLHVAHEQYVISNLNVSQPQ